MDRAEFRIRARSLDRRLERLAGEYENLLAELRAAVDAGNRHLDPDGMVDKRLDRICFQLVCTDSVFPVDAAPQHASDERSQPPRWWHADIEQRTHMDLRRWLDRCHRDGLLALQLTDFPAGIRQTAGDRLLSASDDERAVERVVRTSEQTWLLEHWPAVLREQAELPGRARGQLA